MINERVVRVASPAKPIVITFGAYEFNPHSGELRKEGMHVRLEGQPLAILQILLDRPGELITREELQKKLWAEDTFVDFEHSLNAAVKRLRSALNDSADRPRYIETLARRGYRFVAPVSGRFIADIDSGLPSTPSVEFEQPEPRWKRTTRFVGVALLIALSAGALAYLGVRPSSVPRVSNYVQLTHDGQPKVLVGTDGSRIYLRLGTDVSIGIGEIPISGGEPTRIPAPSPGTYPLNLSPDGSQLLVTNFKIGPDNRSLWSLPVMGGSPRRLGDTLGDDATLSPDGKLLAYSNDNNLFVAKADGTGPRKLFTVTSPSEIDGPVWSPDGTLLRFNLSQGWTKSLWEVAVDGSRSHQLLPGWRNPPDECCGRWTADGKYFVFQSNGQIWALSQKHPLLYGNPKPVQLTSSPLALSTPVPSWDGKKLFVTGETDRGELVRYDIKSGQFVPFLGGISAEYFDVSKDGQWVAYVSYPEGTLWRSRVDGSERLQLTFPPQFATVPHWSPDGKAIVFGYRTDGEMLHRIYEVSSEGGTPRELLPNDQDHCVYPDWSPDGGRIVFGGRADDPKSLIRILDFTNGQISTVPGSQGFFWPSWSPNGRYIVARGFGPHRLMLFDFKTERWTQLARAGYFSARWSKDGQYVYAVASIPESAVVRIRISDLTLEQVIDLKNFTLAGFGWLALAPDDSPLLLRDTGTQDVYALDWEEP